MDDTQALECTQALPADWDEDDDNNSGEKRIVAWLEIEGVRHDIFEGETKIGRDQATCGIVLQNKVLSKEHALFDIEGETHTLADLGSMNKTRIGKMVLKPKVRYALHGDELIRFGDIRAKYIINEKIVLDDSGSETGSESMLLIDNTQEAPNSPVLSHQLPGLDITNNNSSCSTPKVSQIVPQDISDFIPETPTVEQPRGSSSMKTFIPESPSASQSTPLPHKSKAFSVAESPCNISVIQNMSAGVGDEDSFFFDPSQPVKHKIDKRSEKDEIATSDDVRSRVNDDNSIRDEDDDSPTQIFDSPKDVKEKNDTGKELESKTPEMNSEGDRNLHANDNSGANIDNKEDIFNQPTQAFTHIDKSPNKILEKKKVTISSFVDSKDNDDENTDSEEDIFNQPTQAFSNLNPSPKKLLKQKVSELSSSVQGDPDNTQDIMEAFEMVPVKSNSENSAQNEDSDDESLIATQPFVVKGSPAKAKHQDDDDYVSTQLFLDDDDEIVFKKPFTVAPKFRKSNPSVAISNDDIQDELFNDDNQDVLDTPTQAFVADDKDDLEAPTQAFAGDDKDALEDPTQTLVFDDKVASEVPTQAFYNDPVPSEAPTQAYDDDLPPTQKFDPKQEAVSKEKEPEAKLEGDDDYDSDVDDYFNQPTQPFLAENTDRSLLERPTQCFRETSPKNITKDDNDEIDDFFNEPTQAFAEAKHSADIDFDAPTQLFGKRSEDVGARSEDESLPPTHSADIDSDAPTQLFGKKSEEVGALSEDESLPPTQIFTAPSPNVLTPKRDEQVDDSLMPTQPLPKDSTNTPKTSENTSAHSEPYDIDAPTQIFQEPLVAQDTNEPPQVFHDEDLAKSAENIAPTQVFESDANATDGDCRASTQLFIPEDKTSLVNRPQRGISEIWDKLDADATQDISLNVDVNIDETRLANESNLQVLSERKELVNKEDYKGSDMNYDDDNSSTVSENLLEQTPQPHYQDCQLMEVGQETKDENYYSDESTDMEDEILAPKDTVKVQEVKNNASILQTSNMSRLELSSDSDIIPEVKDTVTQPPKNETSHQELEGQKDKPLDGEKKQIYGDNGSQQCKAQKEGASGKPGIHFTRVSKVVASDPVVLKSVGKAANYSQSTQDSTCVEDIKIYSSDSDDSDSMDSKNCKSVSEKVKEVAEILSDSETDDDVGNVSQRLFEFSQENEVDKGIGKQTSNKDKFEEEYHHNTKGRDKTEKQDKQIHALQCRKAEKRTVENMTKDNKQNIQKEDKKETLIKSKINTRKSLMKQIQSPIDSHSKNYMRNMINKKEIFEKSDKCREVGAEETKCNRTTRGRRRDKRQSLDLDSNTEQKTKSGRISREPRRFYPDIDSEVADTSSASVVSKGKTVNISKNMEEHVGVLLSKRTQSITPSPLKKDYKNEEETTISSSAKLGNSPETDPNRVDSLKKGLQRSVPQTKEVQCETVGEQVKKDPGEREQRSTSKTVKEQKIEEQIQQSSLETVGHEKKMEVQRKTNRASITLKKNLVTVSEEQSLEPVRRGRRSAINNPKEGKTEKASESNRETRVTVADIVHKEENVHTQSRQCRSVYGRPKENRNISTNQITKPETEEKKIIRKQEDSVEPCRRGRKSAITKSEEVMIEEADENVKQKSIGTSVKNNPEELTKRANQKMLQKSVEDSIEEPFKQKVKIQPSRRGRRSAVPKSKDGNTENISVTDNKGIEIENEPSRQGRRSAIQKSVESGILNQVRETEDNDTGNGSKEKTAGRQKRARRWVVSETKEMDESTDSEKTSSLKLTIKSMQKESETTSRPQRRGRASIATSHPTVKEVPRSTRQVRLSMIPERLDDENGGPSKSKKLKKSQGKELGGCSFVEEKLSEMKVIDKGKQKQKNSAEESSDSESSSKRSSSQESQRSQGRKRARRNSNSSEDLHSTPKSARTRTKVDSPYSKGILWSPSQRQQQADIRPKVLFTGYKDQQDEKIVTDLGGMVVESPKECSVLVTMNIRRTCKLLAVIGKGMPIVTPQWLSASKLARNFVDPWKYIVKDTESEKKFAFQLHQSLQSARKSLLFEGLSFHATRSVKPPPDQMKEIIVCSGGIYMDVLPKRYSPEIRIISCAEDKNQWGAFKKLQIPVLGTEFILTGLLRHQLLLDDFILA
ncbi:uncharacterized protein LOC125036181 [Penaeus chinensis]|uniref:uncharacterized protein LOC125036181 n=1 Tax=Penaeus chinensis TaxID=139456 RepID=UPI001FB57444|nr:uncharacterized protein LOC125036181 [Penaeus chinensis]XP_047484578.1 uncharacterized protein LOC125036181 [Penaeus chinensis]XP_047484579.1 uncharacterized protein LOC125036181 [Penaeus chinensis]XP_047484580.1 uncharacterized protein LOC125036181 [Penaeus chinensis]